MISKKWQRRNFTIEHLFLFGVWAGTIFWFEFPLPAWFEVLVVTGSGLTVFLLGRYFHRRSGANYVKVFRTGIEEAMHSTKQVFKAQRIPFRKMPVEDGYQFEVYGKEIFINLEAYPLNLPLDLNFVTVHSTKITLTSPKKDMMPLIKTYCEALDEVLYA